MNIDRDEELEQETVDAAEQAASELQAQASALSRENVDAVLSQFLLNQNAQVDATAVLNEIDMFARRIELINLYRALLNQPLFGEGGDEALKAGVEKEIRGFVVSRLKNLLGIAKPAAPTPQQVISQFSDNETEALKMIASKITGKAPSVSASPKSVAPRINPVSVNSGATVITKPEGKPTLVVETDPRPALLLTTTFDNIDVI